MTRRVQHLSKILQEIAEEKNETDFEKLVDAFFTLLKEKNSLYLVPPVIKFLERQIQQQKQTSGVTVTSAKRLNEDLKQKINSKFHAVEKFAQYKINPALIGGIIVKHADMLYDFSIKGQIQSLKKCLSS